MKKLDEPRQSNQQIPKQTVDDINAKLKRMMEIALAIKADAEKIVAGQKVTKGAAARRVRTESR
jgi:hypothetical protein